MSISDNTVHISKTTHCTLHVYTTNDFFGEIQLTDSKNDRKYKITNNKRIRKKRRTYDEDRVNKCELVQ